MRAIDADKLLGLFVESGQKHGGEHGVKLGENWLLGYNDIKTVIDNAPTVDTTFREVVAYECGQKSVEERHKGKWVAIDLTRGHSQFRCSCCQSDTSYIPTCLDKPIFRFCPNCGADMKGDDV